MIKSLHAENFKCFKELDLSDLERVNVVVGKNATGKTVLLEAIRLALGGTPNVLWTMNQARGFFAGVPQPITREIFESLWSPYFFNFETSNAISMDCCDSENHHATIRIFFDVQRPVTIAISVRYEHTAVPQQLPQQQPQQPQPVLPSSFIPPLAFERSNFSDVKSTLYASVQMQGGLNFDSGPELGSVTEIFPSSAWSFNAMLPAQMFSQLSQQQREKAIVDAVRDEFDRSLESLVVLAPAGAPVGLYVGLRYLREKLPIGYLSAGISRFIAMLSAVLIRGKGVVLIDEIENGISYKIFEPLWKYLLKFAVDNDTQIFASTHSLECVRALLPAMEGHEHEFTLLRAERMNGSSAITLVPGKFLESAIDQGVEVR
jgi:ABC-type transport system involved in cytochrome c biogenesis ATPase subunit